MHFGFVVELILEMLVEPASRFVGPSLANDKKEIRKIRKSYIFCIIVFAMVASAMGYATFSTGEEPFYFTVGIIITGIFAIFSLIKLKRFIVFNLNVRKARQQILHH